MPLGARKRAEEARAAAAASEKEKAVSDTTATESSNSNKGEGTSDDSVDDASTLRLQFAALRKSSEAEITSLKEQLDAGRVELASLRRNHQTNLKRVECERDMFAAELAKEQTKTGGGGNVGVRKLGSGLGGGSSKVEELEAQLRAARARNSDLEEENTSLREDNKQMLLRLQANKTLGAESGAYEKVVADLVDVKLKLALAQERNEELIRDARGVKDANEVLRTANGDLEKSRQEWVVKCADVEKEKEDLVQQIETLKKQLEGSTKSGFVPPRLSNELQQVPL